MARRRSDNKRKKAPNSCELGAFRGRFGKVGLVCGYCREGGEFWGCFLMVLIFLICHGLESFDYELEYTLVALLQTL